MATESLILVDSHDRELGVGEKVSTHVGAGQLHRALSVFIFNSSGQMLLQRRAAGKMLWPSFWTNTCCSHPRPGEPLLDAAHRRLREEMGFDCPLQEAFHFEYHASFENVGSENELDHVFLGRYDGKVSADPQEASEWKWVDLPSLLEEVRRHPENYTPWFKIALDRVVEASRSLPSPRA